MSEPVLTPDRPVADTVRASWVERAPSRLRPYLRLARYDRPVGFWLVAIPAWAGLALARADGGWVWADLLLALLFGVGAMAVRGAGCTVNDIIDRDLDARVARTADRPLAAGTVGLPAALAFFALQGGVGLLILLYLPTTAQITALLAIPLILAYPLMKRIIWAPQAWLGVTFNWGALVGFAAAEGELRAPAFLLWAGCAAWTFGYDTIYAHQDKEDDALVGVKSTARWFGTASRAAVAASYAVSAGLFALAYLIARPGDLIGAAAIIAIFGGLLWRQTERARFDDPDDCLAAFKSNVRAGLAMAAVMATAPMLAGALPL